MEDQLIERIPPQSVEAEQAVLGSVLLDVDVFVQVMGLLTPADFYKRSHQLIFDAMVSLYNNDEAIDVITVTETLHNREMLDNAGGADYIYELAEKTPTAANAEYYAKIVEEKSLLRKLIHASNEIARDSYEEQDDVMAILDSAERSILGVSEQRNRAGFKHIQDIVMANIGEIERLSQGQSDVTGLATGYTDLDHMTAGLQKDQLIILAARPAVGKTAFALNIAQNVATKQEATVAIFSLEMSAESLVNRMLCAEGSIDASRLRTGQLQDQEWSDLVVAMGALGDSNIFIDDTPGIRVAEIRAKARRLQKEQGQLDLIVIDYLQLIEGSGRRNENRQQEVSEISRQLKKLAKELEVPVIALSQLSRGVEQRQDKRPVLSDIRESGSIEQDADIVAFLYREDYYRSEDGEEAGPEADNNIVEVIIEKNRAGARGTVKLIFTKEFNKFSSVSFREDENMFA
ncbi:replicative DNA helicase [Aerococcus kribbianus]|uniref:Replicative DNA helicase n=1 Tax=Aerococcus kribbianus TaxID=2999064 RepID=A0A9X3FN96_9LACT|nr:MULTISPECIES: replicative DNA helicase [unclassified Aerococcus]MCZ0717565.1 replicative DNA helicase [Aerococcus sp. YH-aer221]MCZ0725853.1 replicative DNA helicase [Aerococcus sp. YH-aer222]